MRRAILAALAAAATLQGCDSQGRIGGFETAQTLVDTLRERRERADPAAQTAQIDRAGLAGFDSPLILARLEGRGVSALMAPIGTSATGDAIWSTEDDVTLTFRQGVLVASRGIGGDLMSAAAPAPAAVAGSAAGRRHIYLVEDGRSETRRYACRYSQARPVSIVVLERAHATARIEETCRGADGGRAFTNTYWVDAGGMMRKSRQWVSERAGYVTVERLVDG